MSWRKITARPETTLFVLFLAYVCSSIDKLILSLLIEPIKADLSLSDTQISLLVGFAFLVTFSLATVPVGYLVDRVSRTKLIAAGIALWSAMTAFCGMATSFWALFLARALVAIGEATLTPASYSLIAESVSRQRLGFSLALYACGSVVGSGLALIYGGYIVSAVTGYGDVHVPMIGALAPWQVTFLIVGLPGLLLAPLVLLLVEPRTVRRRSERTAPDVTSPTVRAFLRRNRWTIIFHHLAVGLSGVVTHGVAAWLVPFFLRVHGWSVLQVGVATGVAVIIGGLSGLLLGGAISDRAARNGPHTRLIVCALSSLAGVAAAAAYPLVASPVWAATLFGVLLMCAVMPLGAANAALQYITPGEIRGSISALYFVSHNVIGAVGPTAVALVSDGFFPTPDGIRYSLAIVLPLGFLASAACYALAVRPYTRSLDRLGSEPPPLRGAVASPQTLT